MCLVGQNNINLHFLWSMLRLGDQCNRLIGKDLEERKQQVKIHPSFYEMVGEWNFLLIVVFHFTDYPHVCPVLVTIFVSIRI